MGTLAMALCSALAFADGHAQQSGPVDHQPAPQQARGQAGAALLPGDDFYAFANGQWLAATGIPADRSTWSTSDALAEDTDQRILQLIEATGRQPGTGDAARVATYYAAIMDEAGIEARGTAPLRPLLDKIAAIRDKAGLTQALGASLRADVDPLNNTDFSTGNLFGIWIAQGFTDPDNYVPYLLQGGLGMPDRAFYLEENERMSRLRTAYQAHIAAMLKLAGFTEPEERAARVFELERKLAQAHVPREESADMQKANNQWRDRDFAARAPGLDWKAFFASAGLGKQKKFIVYHPRAIIGAAALVAGMPVQTWKDWLAFQTVNQYGGKLPKAFVDQRFEFYGRTLSGTPQLPARWKRGLASLNDAMPEAVGKMYVDRYFPPAAKVKVQQMVTNIIDAFHARIDRLDWMAPSTKREAHAKLKALYVGVGYPEKWTSYAGLDVKPDDAFGNAWRADQFHYRHELAKLGTKVDPKEWSMPPQLVNAAVIRSGRPGCGELWCHRIGHRPRDQPQLRQYRRFVRCQGPPARLVDHGGQRAFQQGFAIARGAILCLPGIPGPETERPAHAGRKPGRPGRPGRGAGCLACGARRQGRHRNRPPVFPWLCRVVAHQAARGGITQPGHHRRACPGPVAYLHGAQPG
jgi:endothelin-converting enzyme/putative endopeptidase